MFIPLYIIYNEITAETKSLQWQLTLRKVGLYMKQIGEIIRDLRKKNQITQEKLAEYLGVSFQSVSRWENGLAYPDVTLIPAIARYFKVSTDTLFDMKTEKSAERQAYFNNTYAEYQRDGKLEARKELMEIATKEFPHNYNYMMNLAETLALFAEGSQSQRLQYRQENAPSRIHGLCQLVLEDCTDNPERYRAVKLLCNYYVASGNIAEALQLTNGVADMNHCREVLLGQILSGDEKLGQLQENILKSIDYAATTMVNMAFRKEYGFTDRLTTEEKFQYVSTANLLYEALLPDGNYQVHHRTIGWNYRRLAELSLLMEKREEAFQYLLRAEKEAVAYDNLRDFHYTAPLVNTLEYNPISHSKSWEGSEQGMLLYRLGELKGYFEGHNGFEEMVKRLQSTTKGEVPVQIE